MSGALAAEVLADHLEDSFDTEKVAEVLDCYCRLHASLRTQALRAADISPIRNVETLSLGHPRIAQDHAEMVQSLSRDFSETETAWLLTHPRVKERRDHMWQWMALAEAAMECQYSAQLSGEEAQNFFNFESYSQLVEGELTQLGFPKKEIILRDFESIAFVGAGPLPLSAIMIHQKTGLRVTCIDCDKDSAALGKAFIEKCGLSREISYRHARGDQVDYCIHPYIFIAGLVQDKESVVCQIGMSRGGNTIAVRSAMGVGGLLDRPLSIQMTELLYIFFDRHTPAQPPFFNTTWFSSWPFWRLRVDSTVTQVTRPPLRDSEDILQMPKTGRQHLFSYNL